MKEKISILPHPSLFGKLDQNYTLSQAMGELADNSVAARLDSGVTIEIIIKSNSIKISDDGIGMSAKKMREALTIAISNWDKKGGLGEFGLGLKAGTMSLGTSFVLTSTSKNDSKKYSIKFDRLEFEKAGKWEIEMQTESSDLAEHGTSVEILNLKTEHSEREINKLRDDFSKRYGPYIHSKNATINIGSSHKDVQPCLPIIPQIIEGSRRDFSIDLPGGHTITGWYGIAKNPTAKSSGFDLFRRGRLILEHKKLGYQHHPSLNYIVGEINLDHIEAQTNKREFMEETKDWRNFMKVWGNRTLRIPGFIDQVIKYISEYVSATEKIIPVKQQKILLSSFGTVLQGDSWRELGRTPGGNVFNIGHVMVVKRKKPTHTNVTPGGRASLDPDRIINKRNNKKTLRVGNRQFTFAFREYDIKDESVSSQWAPTNAVDLDIVINTGFIGYKVCKDMFFYRVREIAESIAIYAVSLGGEHTDIISTRNKLFKDVSKILIDENSLENF